MKIILNLLLSITLIFNISCTNNSSTDSKTPNDSTSLKITNLHRGKMGEWIMKSRGISNYQEVSMVKGDTVSKQTIPYFFRFDATLIAMQLKYNKELDTWIASPLNSIDSSEKSKLEIEKLKLEIEKLKLEIFNLKFNR